MTRGASKNKAKPRKPHNARTAEYGSFDELLTQIAAEPRKARMGDQEVTMPRIERLLRVMVARALARNVREVTKLLGMMAKSPALVATFREEMVTVISGDLANV